MGKTGRLADKLRGLFRSALPRIRRIFALPPSVILALFPASTVLCIIALNNHGMFPALEYLIYITSAYSLAALIFGMGGVVQTLTRRVYGSRIYRWAQENPIARLFVSDFRFRGELSLYQGLLVSTLFAVFKGAAALYYQSAWFAAVAVYYVIFGASRLTLVRSWRRSAKLSDRQERRSLELRSCRLCGILMLALNIGMAAMAVQLIREEHTIAYPGSVIYITAAYTFYIFTLSIVNLVKFRRLNSPVLSASKALNFAGALMSLFSLQNALTSRFGSGDSGFRRIMNSVVGLAVCLTVLAVAVYMIVHSTRSLRRIPAEAGT